MAQSDTRDYVLTVENNKAAAFAIAKETAKSEHLPWTYTLQANQEAELESRQTTLIEVVQSLGAYINHEDEKIRARVVGYLTSIIMALPPTFLSRQQIQVLADFFSARIEDGGAVEGLSNLQGSSRFTKDMAQSVVKA